MKYHDFSFVDWENSVNRKYKILRDIVVFFWVWVCGLRALRNLIFPTALCVQSSIVITWTWMAI